MSLQKVLRVNPREHLAVYTLATLANILISIPQYLSLNNALQLGVSLRGATGVPITAYGSSTGIALYLVEMGLIFQGLMAVLVVGVTWSASSNKNWRWQYTLTSVLTAGYLAYRLSNRFLSTLDSIGVLQASGFDVSNVYAELFWFGLATTGWYILAILWLRLSYGKLLAERNALEPRPVVV